MPERPAGPFCPLCGGVGRWFAVAEHVPLRRCCGVWLAWGYRSLAEYEKMLQAGSPYDSTRPEPGSTEFLQEQTMRRQEDAQRLQWLGALRPSRGHLMDVGAGRGEFVYLAGLAGWNAIGLEINGARAAEANRNGKLVWEGDWRALPDSMTNYDVITLIDVFQMLTEPGRCLEVLRGRLVEGGLVVVEMMELDAPYLSGEFVFRNDLMPWERIVAYSQAAAVEVFERHGFMVEATLRPLGGHSGRISYYLRPYPV